MRITDVEAIILRQPELDSTISDGSQDNVLIKVHTDEGITGVGEVDSSPEVVQAAIYAPSSHTIANGLRGLLVGEDPMSDQLWDKLYYGALYYGRRGAGIHALSGVDLALWDIRGKCLGKPVSELLGNRVRDRIKAYASTLMPSTPSEVEACVQHWVTAGFQAIKLGWGPLGQDPRRDIELIQAARGAAGDGVNLLIDFGLGYRDDAQTALYVADAVAELDLFCMEEPFYPDELDAYATLSKGTEVPVSSGENLSSLHEFQDLVERGGIDIVQPDVTRCGGLTAALKIAAMAAERDVPVMPHAWKSGIIKAATAHLLAVIPNGLLLEYAVAATPINSGLASPVPQLEDGHVRVPQSPGLGIEINPDVIAAFRVDH